MPTIPLVGRVAALAVALIASLIATNDIPAGEAQIMEDQLIDRAELKGIDLDGRLHRFTEDADCRGVVVVFLSTKCPISNTAIPTLQKLESRFADSGINLYGVISNPGTNRAEAIAHRDEYHISFPVIFDASNALRKLLKPTHTPQAMVISPLGKIVYSGRIDNRFSEIGRRREQATVNDLNDAVTSVSLRRHVKVPVTQPIGCFLENLPTKKNVAAVTYHRDIAPIIYSNCSECHRPNESSPFSLLCYEDACAHAQQMVAVTKSRFMPPWHPVKGYGHFRNERGLSDDEIILIQQWVASGMPEGDEDDAPPRPTFPSGWRLGKPDLVLSMDEAFELSSDGPDVHQHFVLPTKLRKNRLVSAVEFHPGNTRVVHHACFYVDNTRAARALADRHPDVGYGSFVGPGFANVGALRSWLPGMSPQRLPKGTGQPLHARSDLVLEIHYQRNGKVESDQSEVGIYFAKRGSRQLVGEIQVMNKDLVIPAGESEFRHSASFTLPVDATLLDAAPHMHLLGREMKAKATLPDGTIKPLVWIKDWDFNWQGQYLYANPMRLPKGTRIEVEAIYDNSDGNPLNPSFPPRQVSWGEQTDDEMGVCHFRYTCESFKDLVQMNTHYLKYSENQQRRYRSMQDRIGVSVKPIVESVRTR